MTTPAKLNELNSAEDPARELLERLGYTYVAREELAAEREGERDVLLKGRMTAALLRLNEWMTEDHAQRIIFNVRNIDASGLARNREIHTYLAYGMPLTIQRDGRQETPTVRFFDFDHPEPGVGLNDYVVTTQFRVRRASERGGARTSEDDEKVVKPDLVLFVNGIPLVVMEAKSPTLGDVWKTQAVRQLRRYQEAGPGVARRRRARAVRHQPAVRRALRDGRRLRQPRRARERLRLDGGRLSRSRTRSSSSATASRPRARRGSSAGCSTAIGAPRHPARLCCLPARGRPARQEAAALPTVPGGDERHGAHPRRPRAARARRRGLAHAGVRQIADDALARDEAAALAGAAQPDDRRRHGPHATRPARSQARSAAPRPPTSPSAP